MPLREDKDSFEDEIIATIKKILFEFLMPYKCKNLKEFLAREDIPEEKKEEARGLARKIIDLGLQNDSDIFAAYKYSVAIGETDGIIKRMKQGLYSNDKINYDLVQTALNYGNDEDMQQAVSAWRTVESKQDSISAFLNEGTIKKIVERIKASLNQYSKDYNLPKNKTLSAHINAAMEIAKQEYDLAVGIQRGCVNVTTILEAIGQRTRYVRYSPAWEKRGPYWEKVGRHKDKPTKAKKIIVCEDDTVTGKTLKAVQPLIEKLEPQTVDICFMGMNPEISRERAEGLGFYTNVTSTMSYSFDHFVENLRAAEAALRELGY